MNKRLDQSATKVKNNLSLVAIFIVFAAIFFASFVYYPKWNKGGTEKVISWDVAGYYQYLPALFIYDDLEKASYIESMIDKYGFTPENQSTLPLPNGNRVMKYSMGQSIMFGPFFFIGHLWALNSDFEADGFSTPYQLAIGVEILFFALLGLWFFRLILLRHFSDTVSAVTILGIGLGSNYLEYTSITGGMTHNNIFALYSILIYTVMSFYEKPSFFKAFVIGSAVGLAALTRPIEVISVLIVLLWGLENLSKNELLKRWKFIKSQFSKFILMALATGTIGSFQLLYWKYVSGDWLVYSYGNEGFDWLSPHIKDGFISMKAGWLVYSPIMIFSLIGFYFLYQSKKKLFYVALIFSLAAIYIVFSWQTWWYGGSLGQRALIQYYPLLALPMAACVQHFIKSRWSKNILFFFFVLFSYYNIWLIHQAHKGGMLYVSQMTRPYFWKVVGRYEKVDEHIKLLDTDEFYSGERKNVQQLYTNNFENEAVPRCHLGAIEGEISPCLSDLDPSSPKFSVPIANSKNEWVRVQATLKTDHRVWSIWSMGRMIIRFYNGPDVVKEKSIRYHRLLRGKKERVMYLDSKMPKELFDRVELQLTHGGKGNIVLYDNVQIETFD